MESDVGAFDQHLSTLEAVLAEVGMPNVPAPSSASSTIPAGSEGDAHVEPAAAAAGAMVGAEDADVVGEEGVEEKRRLLAGELSPAVVLVVLVTAMCRWDWLVGRRRHGVDWEAAARGRVRGQ